MAQPGAEPPADGVSKETQVQADSADRSSEEQQKVRGPAIWIPLIALILTASAEWQNPRVFAAESIVYSVYKELDMGNPGEIPQKDYYLTLGAAQGLREGMFVRVLRRASTYDLLSEKLYKDVLFPIARLKVIHSEANAAIARLDKLLPATETPAYTPRAVMVGDLVEISE
jgi:hypothetical protein